MSIVIRRPWTRQPQTAVAIDSGNPLARGLVGLWIPSVGSINLASNVPSYLFSATRPTQYGIGAEYAGSISTESRLLSADFSFLIAFTLGSSYGSSTNPCVLSCGNTTGSNNTNFGFNAKHSASLYNGAIYCGTSYNIVGYPFGNVVLTLGERYVAGASVSGSAGSVYADGIKVSSNTGLSARYTSAGRLAVGYSSTLAAGDYLGSLPSVEYVAIWNRALTDSEHLLTKANGIYRVLVRQTQRIWTPAAAAATAPTLSALSAINVTSTSAQPRITYTF